MLNQNIKLKQYPLFVYGTLLEGFRNEQRYLKGKVSSRQKAKLRGGRIYHLSSFHYPILVLDFDHEPDSEQMIETKCSLKREPPGRNECSKSSETIITGELIFIKSELYEQVMAEIDQLEGYIGKADPQNLYDKILVEVYTKASDKPQQAIVYCYPEGKALPQQIVPVLSGDWAGFVREHGG